MECLSSAVINLANDKKVAVKLRQIGEGISQEEKQNVLSVVVDIAMADDELDAGEVRAIATAGQILGISQNRIYSEPRAVGKK